MNIKDIYINPNNPRYIKDERYQKLKKSIQEFPKMMKLRPIIIDDNGMILGGNMRYLAMVDLGYKEIPEGWIIKASELTEEEKKRFIIADNVEFGEFNYDILANEWELEELQEWGIELPELEDVIKPNEKDDEIPELPKEPKSKLGDLYQLGEHRLLCGDATKREDVEKLMDGKKAGILLTDPPYAVAYVEKARDMNRLGYVHSRATLRSAIKGDGIDEKGEKQLWQDSFKNALDIALEERIAIYAWHDSRRAMLKFLIVLDGLDLLHHQTIIWNKNNFVIGRCDYQAKHENCWYGWRKGYRPEFLGKKNQTTVWDISKDNNPQHPTQKPIAILLPSIKNHIGDVYDPFLGSGSTLIACEQLNRICYGMEIDPVYIDVIIERWENYVNKKVVKINGRE